MERSSSRTRPLGSGACSSLGRRVALDVVTKAIAAARCVPQRLPAPVHRRLAAADARLQPGRRVRAARRAYSRPIFVVLTVGALAILWRLYRATRAGDVGARARPRARLRRRGRQPDRPACARPGRRRLHRHRHRRLRGGRRSTSPTWP